MEVFAKILAFLSLASLATDAEALLCWIGQEPDPGSNYAYRWVIPVPDPCQCTEVRVAGMSTETPCRPFKVTYHKTFLHTDDREKIRRFLDCPPMELDVRVNLLPEGTFLSVGIQQELTFELELTPRHGLASLINGAGQDRYHVTGYICEDPSGPNKLVAEVVTLTSTQDAMAVNDGAALTLSDLSVTFDLTSTGCPENPSNTYFCVEIAPSEMANNPWKLPNNAGSTDCIQICCAEIVDIGLKNLTVTSPDNRIIQDNGTANIELSFYMSTAAMAKNWQEYEVTTWLTNEQSGEVNIDNRLTSGTKSDVSTEFDLSSVECNETFTWNVCIDVQPSVFGSAGCYYWTHIPGATTTLCTPIYCIPDVQVNLDGLSVTRPDIIADGQVVPVFFDLNFIPGNRSTTYVNNAGDNRYRVNVYLANQPDSSGITKVFTQAVLSSNQMQLNITENVPGVFSRLSVELDMREETCDNVRYICAELLPSQEAKMEWIQSRDATQVHCVQTCCARSVNRDLRNLGVMQPYNDIVQDEGTADIDLSFNFEFYNPKDFFEATVRVWIASDSADHLLSPVDWNPKIIDGLDIPNYIYPEFDLSSVDCNETFMWNVCIEVQPTNKCNWAHSPNSTVRLCKPIYCVPDVQVNVVSLSVTQPEVIADGRIVPVTFDLEFFPGNGSTSYMNNAGDDRYQVNVYLTDQHYSSGRKAFTQAVLSSDQMQLNITENVPGVFSGLNVSLSMLYETCYNVRYICAELLPSQEAKLEWIQSRDASRVHCTQTCCARSVNCRLGNLVVLQPYNDIVQDEGTADIELSFSMSAYYYSASNVTMWLESDSPHHQLLLSPLYSDASIVNTISYYKGQPYIIKTKIKSRFDLSSVDCNETFTWNVCIEVQPTDKCNWAHRPGTTMKLCAPIYCVPDVQVNIDNLSAINPDYILDDDKIIPVTFDLHFTPGVKTTSHVNNAGHDRYRVIVSLTDEDYSQSTASIYASDLSQDLKQLNISENDPGVFSEVKVDLDFSIEECWGVHYLCVQLLPSLAASKKWIQSRDANTSYCVSITCVAVQEINVGSVDVTEPTKGVFKEGIQPNFTFNLVIQQSPRRQVLHQSGYGYLYEVRAFLSADELGIQKETEDSVNLLKNSWEWSESGCVFHDLFVSFNVTGVNCSWDVSPYLCVEIGPLPDARVWMQSNHSINMGCTEIKCPPFVTLDIVAMNLTWPANLTFMSDSYQTATFDLEFMPQSDLDVSIINGAGEDRYRVKSYLSKDAAGNDKQHLELANLTQAQKSMDVWVGEVSMFQNLSVTFDLTSENFKNQRISNHFCLNLSASSEADIDWIQSSKAVAVKCIPIACQAKVKVNVWYVVVDLPPGANLLEPNLTFSVTFKPSHIWPVKRAAEDRYAVSAYLTRGMNESITSDIKVIELDADQKSTGFRNNDAWTISDLHTEVDMDLVNCSGRHYSHLCAELEPSEAGSRHWIQSSAAITTRCFPICCEESIDIQLDNHTIAWPSNITLKDKISTWNNAVDVRLSLFVSQAAASLMTAMPRSFDYYVITVWGAGNRSDEVIVTNKMTENLLLQTGANESNCLVKEMSFALNLTTVDCFLTPITQVCLRIERYASPDRCYWNYLPSFINQTCVPATCIPHVYVAVDGLSVISPQYISDSGAMYGSVTFDLQFTGHKGSSVVVNSVGDDRYRINVYLARNLYGDSPKANADADLTPSQKQQNITDFDQFEFSQVTVQLDLANVDCSTNEYKYLCAELLPSVATETLWSQKYRSHTCVSMPCVVCHDQTEIPEYTVDWRVNSMPLRTNSFTFDVQTDNSATFGLRDPLSPTTQVTVNLADGYLNLLLSDGTTVQSAPHSLMVGMVTLWVWWHGTTFQVGSVSSGRVPILNYTMPHQLDDEGVQFGIRTPATATDSWLFCNIEDGGIPPRFTYPSYPAFLYTEKTYPEKLSSDSGSSVKATTNGKESCRYDRKFTKSFPQSLSFKVQAINDVHLFLSNENRTQIDKKYEISIGSAHVDEVTIVRHRQYGYSNGEVVARAAYPWLMNFYDYTTFKLEVSTDGTITVRDPKRVLLSWRDPNPFQVQFLSFCTRGDNPLNNYGKWQFYI